jgi:hypothetical protein
MRYINSIIYNSTTYITAVVQIFSLLFSLTLKAETIDVAGANFTVSGIDGTSSYKETVCPGFNLCFDVFTFGGNQTEKAEMFWDNGIPGAEFTAGNEHMPTGHFCWTPSIADARTAPYVFHITVDNGVLQKVYTYHIIVPILRAEVKTTDISCFGNNDGTATANITGGSGNYLYQWEGIETTSASISHLGAGKVTVHIMDDFGCEATATNLILSPTPLLLNVASADESFSGTGGSAEVIAVGGTMPYTYSWLPGESASEKIEHMPSGVYTAIVTDANGCTTYMPVNISTLIPDDHSAERKDLVTASTTLSNVLVYPNPAQDQFTIKNISDETMDVSVMNNLGQPVYENIRIPANLSIMIPVEELTPGIYVIRAEQKMKVESIRLVKE